MRRTKIVCTIGPATRSEEGIRDLIQSGMNVARLNFSHGSYDEHEEVVQRVRKISQELDKPVAILQDLAGPKIRIGTFADGPIQLEPGATFTLTTEPVEGSSSEVSITYTQLPQDVHPGDCILLADGALELAVRETSDTRIECEVIVGGQLSSKKGINLPSRSIHPPILSEKDKNDIQFGVKQGVDYMALSFVRNAQDAQSAIDFIRESGGDAPIIAKIEKHEALQNFEEILKLVDGVMIARGDLGVEIPIHRIPNVQKQLIRRANQAGKPVITATQMLKSMTDSPRPTRAEVTDVANAILDGSDAVMLSEETAVGSYPMEAVATLRKVAIETEKEFPFHKPDQEAVNFGRRLQDMDPSSEILCQEAVTGAAWRLASELKAKAILALTQSGSTTRMIAKRRPKQPTLAVTSDPVTYRRLALVWGAEPLLMTLPDTANPADPQLVEKEALALARHQDLVKPGDRVIVVAGYPLDISGITNAIRVVDVD